MAIHQVPPPPQNTAPKTGLELLKSLTERTEIKNIWYNNKEITIDGYKFIDCRFDNCKLHISSDRFELENCFIDDGTQVIYGGNTVRIVKLFNKDYDWAYQSIPNFAPTKSSNGTISIK